MWGAGRFSRHEVERDSRKGAKAQRADLARGSLRISIMQISEQMVRSVVNEVLMQMRNGKTATSPTKESGWGVFDAVDPAIAAAAEAQKQFERRGLDERKKAIDCIRRVCIDQAETLGREEF